VTRRPLVAGLVAGVLLVAGCGDDGGDEETFCAKVREFNEGTQSADLNIAADEELAELEALLDEIQDAAPAEIEDDVDARFAYLDDLFAAVRDGTQPEEPPENTEEERIRIDAYTQETCGISLEPSTPPVSRQ
jgi:hypothetical protein